MAKLTENQKSFVRLMKKSDEHARRGFDLLGQREDPSEFFDELSAAGIFEPQNNPGPVRVDDRWVRIPGWPATAYLLTCAKISNERGDATLGEKVMGVVRAVSLFTDETGNRRDNFHTFAKFAEILGVVPRAVVTLADVDLAGLWLGSRYDRSLVAHALDGGAIKRFLASGSPDDLAKATQLLRHCVAFHWQSDKRKGRDDEEPVTVVDPYWLKEILDHHAVAFGSKVGSAAADIMKGTVRELFSRGGRSSRSYLFRAAVENHGQNHSWKSVDNCIVEGLRDVLTAWSDVDANTAKSFVDDILHSDVEMLRRIGIHMLDIRWAQFGDLYSGVVNAAFFDSGHIHELFNLLQNHFEQFGSEQKAATIAALRSISAEEGEDAQDHLKRRWLEAIAGTTYEPASAWLAELGANPKIGVPSHPDFNSLDP